MCSTTPPDSNAETQTGPASRFRVRGSAGWRSALREFAVIVAGVLAALGAQAWWESRQEREREQEYLYQLLADTRENERRLDEAIAQDSVTEQAIARAVSALQAPELLPPSDSLVKWILRSGVAADFQPLTGASGALLTTGDLRLVRNDTLRSRLVAHVSNLESEKARQQQIREATLDMIGPMARTFPFIRGVFLDDIRAEGFDFERLRNDPDATAVLFSAQAANVNRLSGLKRVRQDTERMLRALEAEPALRSAEPSP